uniref:Uncharacterized protein n=1 Tax=Setaria viridis TaxID=4556 RepID=A0A4V6D6I8_SETVI|nr:hypothetical protein SEVIR_5G177500v2 [Setaria viridis]
MTPWLDWDINTRQTQPNSSQANNSGWSDWDIDTTNTNITAHAHHHKRARYLRSITCHIKKAPSPSKRQHHHQHLLFSGFSLFEKRKGEKRENAQVAAATKPSENAESPSEDACHRLQEGHDANSAVDAIPKG